MYYINRFLSVLCIALCSIAGTSFSSYADVILPNYTSSADLWLDDVSSGCYPAGVPLTANFQFYVTPTAGATYRVKLEYKRFDIYYANLFPFSTNEATIGIVYSPSKVAASIATQMNVATFYDNMYNYPVFNVTTTMTGHCKVYTTLQKLVGTAWTDIQTVASPMHGNTNTVITAPNITVMKANLAPTFKVNGVYGLVKVFAKSAKPPTLCAKNLIMNNISGSFADARISVSMGILKDTSNGQTFQPTSVIQEIYFPNIGAKMDDQNLSVLFATLLGTYGNGASDYLQVTLKLGANACDADQSPKVISYVFRLVNGDFLSDYNLYRTTATGLSDNKKTPQFTLPIANAPDLADTTLSLAAFSDALAKKIGWQGATTAGLSNINVDATGSSWTMRVYEVDGVTGIRKNIGGMDAPDVAYKTGTLTNGIMFFNDVSRTFSDATAFGSFHVDTTTPFSFGYYFSDYYDWAKSISKAELTAFSAKTWCVEFSTTGSSLGCTGTRRSFFRIASNYKLQKAVLQRGAPQEGNRADEEGYSLPDEANSNMSMNHVNDVTVFPNPATSMVVFTFHHSNTASSIIITDYLGNVVRKSVNITDQRHQMDLGGLAKGLYLYKIQSGNNTQQGKLIKQ